MAPAMIAFILLALLAVSNAAIYEYAIYSDQSQSVVPGQNLTYDMIPHGLPFGPHELAFGYDCNLVLSAYGKRTWSTNTSQQNGESCYLTLLPDGELVLRHAIHYPVWSSGVKSSPGKYAFILNWNGQLQVIGPELWTNTDKVRISEPYLAPSTTDYILYSGQFTMATYGILVIYKNFRLVLRQADCNLVLEDMNTWEVLWETGTNSTAGDCFATLDNFGELFIKHKRREVLWRSGKRSDKEGSALVLRYDGRLAIYSGIVWAAPTPSGVDGAAAATVGPHSMAAPRLRTSAF